jgi:nitronate monooxygenase
MWFDGPLILSGLDRHRPAILAAQAMGADLAYIGSPFIATPEARCSDDYRQAIVESGAADIVNSALFTGIPGNYLRSSIERSGLDPTRSTKWFAADRVRLGRIGQEQGVARHLGIGPGDRRDRKVQPAANISTARPRICASEGAKSVR